MFQFETTYLAQIYLAVLHSVTNVINQFLKNPDKSLTYLSSIKIAKKLSIQYLIFMNQGLARTKKNPDKHSFLHSSLKSEK